MKTFTFTITDLLEWVDSITLTIEASNLEAAKKAAHIRATARHGFDNDFTFIEEA